MLLLATMAGCATPSLPRGSSWVRATDTPSAPPPLRSGYSTEHPGPGCDPLQPAHVWSVGARYRSHGTDVEHSDTSAQCGSDGLLVTRHDDTEHGATVWLTNPGEEPLADNYRFQVTARVVKGSDQTALLLDVDDQTNYGGEVLELFPDGQWEIFSVDDQTDEARSPDSTGKLEAMPETLTLQAEVHSQEMSFSLSGQHLATVRESHYRQTNGIGFALYDEHLPGISALFSHFVYTPL